MLRWYSTTRWNDTQSGFVELKPWHVGAKFGDKRYGRNPNTKDAQRQFELFQSSEVWFVGALDTGLRKSDLTNLPRRGVKFKDGVVKTVMNKTGVEVTIPLGSVLAEHFKQSMRRAKGPISTETPVILTPRGKRYDESTLKRYFKIAKWIAGITRRVRLHDLRHSFASDMGSEGYNEHVLMGLLGHTTTEMTRRYVRPHASVLDSIRRHIDARHLSPESTESSER
jgi:integrase